MWKSAPAPLVPVSLPSSGITFPDRGRPHRRPGNKK
jgi:hypothetical protein